MESLVVAILTLAVLSNIYCSFELLLPGTVSLVIAVAATATTLVSAALAILSLLSAAIGFIGTHILVSAALFAFVVVVGRLVLSHRTSQSGDFPDDIVAWHDIAPPSERPRRHRENEVLPRHLPLAPSTPADDPVIEHPEVQRAAGVESRRARREVELPAPPEITCFQQVPRAPQAPATSAALPSPLATEPPTPLAIEPPISPPKSRKRKADSDPDDHAVKRVKTIQETLVIVPPPPTVQKRTGGELANPRAPKRARTQRYQSFEVCSGLQWQRRFSECFDREHLHSRFGRTSKPKKTAAPLGPEYQWREPITYINSTRLFSAYVARYVAARKQYAPAYQDDDAVDTRLSNLSYVGYGEMEEDEDATETRSSAPSETGYGEMDEDDPVAAARFNDSSYAGYGEMEEDEESGMDVEETDRRACQDGAAAYNESDPEHSDDMDHDDDEKMHQSVPSTILPQRRSTMLVGETELEDLYDDYGISREPAREMQVDTASQQDEENEDSTPVPDVDYSERPSSDIFAVDLLGQDVVQQAAGNGDGNGGYGQPQTGMFTVTLPIR